MTRIHPKADVIDMALAAYLDHHHLHTDKRGRVWLAPGRDLLQYQKAVATLAVRGLARDYRPVA